jgi:hypothetical protein
MVVSSGLELDDEYMDFRLPRRRQFQSKSINPFDDMKERGKKEWKVLLFGSGRLSWVQ